MDDKKSTNMRAVYLTRRPPVGGLASQMHLDGERIPAPQARDLQPHEVLVRVHAFSLNVDDLHVAEGSFLGGVPGLQSRAASPAQPLVIGSDFAGVVEAAGSAAAGAFPPGQRVCGMNKQQSVFSESGTWAEYTVSRAGSLVRIPDDVGFRAAAASAMPLFVVRGLVEGAGAALLGDGARRVAVIGASGGIGSVLIPVLRRRFGPGLDIAGVCSGRNAAFVRSLGADRVVDYAAGVPVGEALAQGAGGPYDVVFDLVGGGASYEAGAAVLRRGGQFVTSTGPAEWVGDERLSPLGQVVLVARMVWHSVFLNWIPGPHPYYHIAAPTDLDEETFHLAFKSGVRPHIQKAISFKDRDAFEAAIELVRSHRAKGKIVVDVV